MLKLVRQKAKKILCLSLIYPRTCILYYTKRILKALPDSSVKTSMLCTRAEDLVEATKHLLPDRTGKKETKLQLDIKNRAKLKRSGHKALDFLKKDVDTDTLKKCPDLFKY